VLLRARPGDVLARGLFIALVIADAGQPQ
jgi:hypothetical protein